MYPHPLPTYGQEAKLEAWKRFYQNPNNTLVTVDEITVAGSGDMGYIMGRWWSIERNSVKY